MKIIEHGNTDRKNRKAIVTRAKDGYELAPITHPILIDYAKRCQADFIVINEEKIKLGNFAYEIFQCYDLFDTYQRIAVIDTDVLITQSCPNLFEVVPTEKIGVIYEDKYTRKQDRRTRIRNCQKQLGEIGWRWGYVNTGVLVLSRIHRKILTYKPGEVWNNYGYDDVLIGYKIHKYRHPVYELPYKFNHMSMFSEIGKNHLKSYIIHYAGRGFSPKKSRAEQIKSDYRTLNNTPYPFLLNFHNILERLRLLILGLKNLLTPQR
jgi:hypothetical protein